jgi:putative peptidoglycan lipid II flippase
MAGFFLSRLSGFVKEASIVSRFPAGDRAYDAYVAAFRIPDFIYLVVIGGALATALVPIFQQAWHEQGEERAWQVASAVINLALLALVIALPLAALGIGPVVRLLFPREAREQQWLIANLARLLLLSPLLLGLGGVAMALLNARGRFGLPSAAPTIYNLAIIFGAIVLAPRFGIWGVAYGIIIGATLYILVQLPGLLRAGMRYQPVLGVHDPYVRRIGRLLVPRLIGQSAVQINIIATTSFAALLPGTQIGALNLAYQLMLLPHGVFVMSLVTVLFPQMAELYARGDMSTFRETALRAVRMIAFVTIPIAVAIAVLRFPIIRLIFERREFTVQSTLLVTSPLLIYLTSLVAFALSEPLVRSFYAMQDTRTPVFVALGTIAINIGLGYLTVYYSTWGAPGLAFAFSIANNLEAVALLLLLLRRLKGADMFGLFRSLLLAVASATIMGSALVALIAASRSWLPMITPAGAYGVGADAFRLLAWLALAGLVSIIAYVLPAAVLRVPELESIVALVRQRRAA